MYTAEKRAQLEAEGEPWPECDCHGRPMKWNRKASLKAGGHFRCAVDDAGWKRRYRAERKARGKCIYCDGDLATATLCRPCADTHSDRMAEPKQKLLHQLAQMRHRHKDSDVQPLGVGLAAFAAWKRKRPGS